MPGRFVWRSNYRHDGLRRWLCCCLLTAGLASAFAVPALERLKVDLAGEQFELEYVADPDSRRQGLMGRRSLPEGTGMLFDFPEGTQPAIWMRNMRIGLDLLYIDASGEIVQIFRQVPPCHAMPCEIYHARQPLRFVLELPAGTADDLGLKVGESVPLGALLNQPAPRE